MIAVVTVDQKKANPGVEKGCSYLIRKADNFSTK